MSILPELSDRDKAILNSIFNPSLPLGEGVFADQFNDKDNGDDNLEEESQDSDLVKCEIAAIQMAENGKYEESFVLFDRCIEMSPSRAATFNNRAQVYQLQGDTKACLDDLSKAIELSDGKGKAGSQAFCQRGVMFRKDGNTEEARKDFQKAAKLGSAFAKQQLVELNPYAALCNQMLSQVMHKLN